MFRTIVVDVASQATPPDTPFESVLGHPLFAYLLKSRQKTQFDVVCTVQRVWNEERSSAWRKGEGVHRQKYTTGNQGKEQRTKRQEWVTKGINKVGNG